MTSSSTLALNIWNNNHTTEAVVWFNWCLKKEVIQEVITEILAEKQNIVLATGGGAILDADIRSLLSSRGKVVYLEATIEQQLERTAKDTKRPLLRVADKKPVLEELMQEREPLYKSIADVVVETNGATVKNIVNKISNFLVEESILWLKNYW